MDETTNRTKHGLSRITTTTAKPHDDGDNDDALTLLAADAVSQRSSKGAPIYGSETDRRGIGVECTHTTRSCRERTNQTQLLFIFAWSNGSLSHDFAESSIECLLRSRTTDEIDYFSRSDH